MKNIATNIPLLKVGFLLYVLMLSSLISCGDYIKQYSENDGAYYDPESDTLPKYLEIISDNKMGSVYRYEYDEEQNLYNENAGKLALEGDTDSIVKRSQHNRQNQENKYQDWGKSKSSDWGKYIGTRVYVDTYCSNIWRYPNYSWYSWHYPYHSWGYPYYYDWNYPYGMSYGFGWGYNSWGRYYDPFWGWSYYPYYRPYHHRPPTYYRSVPSYKGRESDAIDRSRYNNYGSNNSNKYNNNIYNSSVYKSSSRDSNSNGSSSRSSGRAVGASGGGFRR